MSPRRPAVALLGLMALLALGAPSAAAQAPPSPLPPGVAVGVEVKREGDTIGDPVRLTVVVTHPPEGELLVPPPEGPMGALEPASPVVTRDTTADGLVRVTLVYETRAFATGPLPLTPPALSYRRDGLTTAIQPAGRIIDVRSLLPADGSAAPRGLKPAEQVGPAGFPTVPVAVGGSIGVLLLLAVGVTVARRRRPAPVATVAPGPGALAGRDLDEIAGAGLLPHAVDEFCARINGAVRGYLAARYGLPALNLTASELAERLARAGADAGTVQRVRSLCQACDGIAYAGSTPSAARVARYLDLAQAIVGEGPAPVAAPAGPAAPASEVE
ncbi:MAG: hypothetical protein F4Y94_00290 [Chloroflexi bacterium]|nr:hypothetical protein [Chloroflexota bacterium]